MRKKIQQRRRTLIYDSGLTGALPTRYAGMKAFYSCVIHTSQDDGSCESIDIIPKSKLTLEDMIGVIRRQFLDGFEDDGATRVHFKLYAQDARPQ